MQKPRPYEGPVDFLAVADAVADGWPDGTLSAVAAAFPYPPERGIRMHDWVALVAHVSSTRQEDTGHCAERLALYVKAYRERNGSNAPTPTPNQLRRTQTS